MPRPTNLFKYYEQKGQALPKVEQRAPLFESLGLGPASEYEGTGPQNKKLLKALIARDAGEQPTRPKEGDRRTNPTTGKQEVLAPDGQWREVSPPTDTAEPGEGPIVKAPDDSVTPESQKQSFFLKDDPDYMSLPQDLRDFLAGYYDILKFSSKETRQLMVKALEEAALQADPYFAEQIRIAQTELLRGMGILEEDFESQEAALVTNIERLEEDLQIGGGRISIDKQAELARQKQRYEIQLDSLQESVRHKGLTFSTRRARAERILSKTQQDIVESTERKYQRQLTDLESRARRGDENARRQLTDLKRKFGEAGTTLVRATEAQLGTEKLPALPGAPGATPIGDVTGELYETKVKDIFERAKAMMAVTNPFI